MSLLKPPIQPLLGLAGILTTFVVVAPAFSATLSFTTARTDFVGSDQLDWASLGPIVPPQPFKILPFSFSTNTQGGLGVNVNVPPPSIPGVTPPLLFQTTATGIPTNFAAGDFILFTGLLPGQFPAPGNPGPLTLSFATPVQGLGTQIAVDDTLNFTALISAFDASNNLLGTFSAPGTSSLALDNSALFLGIFSETANISRVEFRSSVPNRAIGINRVSVQSTAVPEPISVTGLILAGLGLSAARKWKVDKAN